MNTYKLMNKAENEINRRLKGKLLKAYQVLSARCNEIFA